MTKEEFLRKRADLIISEISDRYGIQREKDGTHFIYTSMEELNYFIDYLLKHF